MVTEALQNTVDQAAFRGIDLAPDLALLHKRDLRSGKKARQKNRYHCYDNHMYTSILIYGSETVCIAAGAENVLSGASRPFCRSAEKSALLMGNMP